MIKLLKPEFWSGSYINFYSLILLPISIFIQVLIFIKCKFTKKNRFSIPIICIGNIYIGGTGKTPTTLKIYQILKKLGKKPVIVKKYYKNQLDEIDLIKSNTKNIFTAKKRRFAIEDAINKKFNTVILDDGFQDHSIQKSLNILCFNSSQLLGNQHTIPSGPLREKLKSIKRSQLILINGKRNAKFEIKLKKIHNKIKIIYTKYVPKNLKNFKNKKYLAFAGIGNPKNFFDLLDSFKISTKEKVYFPDHYNYSKSDINKLIAQAKKKKLKLITTEKDFYRLKKIGYKNIEYLSVELKIENERLLIEKLKSL